MRIDTERFDVERVVGSGSMGTVFRARDRETGVPVAMKVMRNDHASRAARFDREADVLAHLTHKNIVHYLGHGVTAHGERFLVMEWLDGENLKARIGRTGLTLAETLAAGACVAEGLAYAHQAGIVHRDIKPTNLVLVEGKVERLKIVDFGVAAWRQQERPALTETGDVIGTPAYMAPEQAQGRKVGPPADVFGLGCVLYECTTGRAPFVVARNVASLLSSSTVATAPRVRAVRPEVPEPIADLIERMIARDAAARPADGAAALGALQALAGIDLSTVGTPPRVRRADAGDRTAVPATAEGTGGGFSDLQRQHGSAPPSLSAASAAILAVLSRHVPMPMAVLRSQCERLGIDPEGLAAADLPLVAPALAEAVARFTQPTARALVLAELSAIADEPD